MNTSKHINLSAYNSYELFKDRDSELAYRKSKLESCEKHVSLISNECVDGKIDVLELGSGNSKLLINLQNKGLLNTGYGVEISKNRHEFSQRWINDLGLTNITNFNSDIIGFDYGCLPNLDLCICVDLCFQFLDPIDDGSSRKVLEYVYNRLRPGGKVILELDNCGYIINHLPYTHKVWEEFGENDPWKYSLWECFYDVDKKILNWKKTFISNDNKYEETEIFLRIFDCSDISKVLNDVGFSNIRIYKDWKYSEFDENTNEFIIIAEK
jgi:SAM-dependent methyltransferase